MNPKQNYAARSWTESDQPAKNRPLAIAILTILLVIAVVGFFWLLWPRQQQRVFAFAYAIEESRERQLPRPGFARWALSDQAFGDWNPWLDSVSEGTPKKVVELGVDFSERIQQKQQLKLISKQISERFRSAGGSQEDTLILYLRGLSLVTRSKDSANESQLILLSPDCNDPLNDPDPGISLAKFLEELKAINVSNIVLLADIGDLTAAPQLGLEENDVPTELAKIMRALSGEGESSGRTAIWMIVSRNASQPSHVSYILRKSLLQSSVESALRSVKAGERQLNLPLTEFYESILGYCDEVTGGKQTPILLRSGNGSSIVKGSGDWSDAEKVSVARPRLGDKKSNSSDDKTAEADPGGSLGRGGSPHGPITSPSHSMPNAPIRFASTNFPQAQQNTAEGGNASSSAAGAASNGETEPNSESAPTEPESNPWLRFWKLRDALASRNPENAIGDGWSPVDFAVDRWQLLQREAIHSERLKQLSESTDELSQRSGASPALKPEEEIEKLTRELEGSVTSAWNNTRRTLNVPRDSRRVWLDSKWLASDLQPSWLAQRDALREFMDACSESAAWVELCFESDIGEFDSLGRKSEELIEQVKSFKERLSNRQDSLAILDEPLNMAAINRISATRSSLRDEFNQLVEKYQKLLVSEERQITWSDERVLQVLLSSSLLTYAQRKQLYDDYYSKTDVLAKRLVTAGEDNRGVQLDRAWSSIPTKSAKSRGWGDKLRGLFLGDDFASRWIRACFGSTWPVVNSEASQQETVATGMILPVSSDSGLYAQWNMNPRPEPFYKLTDPFSVTLRRRNGTSLESCWLQWEDRSSGGGTLRLTERASGRTLAPKQAHRVELIQTGDSRTSDNFLMMFELDPGQQDSAADVRVQLRFAEAKESLTSEGNRAVEAAIILRPYPEGVDLFVRRWNDADKKEEEYAQRAIKEDGESLLKEAISVPAINHLAKSEFQLYLCNRSDKDKTFQARIFSVQSPFSTYPIAMGNGRISKESIRRTRDVKLGELNLISEMERILLPGASQSISSLGEGRLPENAKRLNLTSADEAPKSAGQFGLVLVVDELKEQVNADSTTVYEPLGKPHYFWMDCVSRSPHPLHLFVKPSEFLLDIDWQRLDDINMDFTLTVQPENWNSLGLQTLPVEILLTDDLGQPLSNEVSSNDAVAELSVQSNRKVLKARPNFARPGRRSDQNRSPEKVVVHFNIGGYPRATAIEYRTTGGEPVSANQPFLWLDPVALPAETVDPSREILLTDENAEKLVIERMGAASFVIPNRLGVNGKSIGLEVKAKRLSIPFRLDFPKTQTDFVATVQLAPNKIDLRHDRHFDPKIGVKEGRLVFSSAAFDHRFEIGEREINSLRGNLPFTISIARTGQQDPILKEQINIIVDKEDPKDSRIERAPDAIPNAIRLELQATDIDSDIKRVFFAIHIPDRNAVGVRFNHQDLEQVEAKFVEGKWVATITQEAIEKALGEPGEYYIVARSVDLAGNVQDAHRPLLLRWTRR